MNRRKKYVLFGGFDYAVRYEMDQNAIYEGIDYFIENDEKLIGTSYLGKKIYGTDIFEEIKKNKDVFILIGSVIHYAELEIQLREFGFEKYEDYRWALDFSGDIDGGCLPLWKHTEWDSSRNNSNREKLENDEYFRMRYYCCSKFIDDYIKTIVDIGAANERYREFLKCGQQYIPMDYMKYSDITVVYDFNLQKFPDIHADQDKTAVLLVAVIQYVKEWRIFLKEVCARSNIVVITHNDIARVSREYRREHYTSNNAIFNHEIILEMQKQDFYLEDACDFRLKDVLMKFKKK